MCVGTYSTCIHVHVGMFVTVHVSISHILEDFSNLLSHAFRGSELDCILAMQYYSIKSIQVGSHLCTVSVYNSVE